MASKLPISGSPTPLGLFAYSITTLSLMYVEMGWCSAGFDVVVVGSALVFGGLGQILTAILELIRGNSFACTVFGTNGFYWIVYSISFLITHAGNSSLTNTTYTNGNTIWYATWGLVIFCFFVISFRKNIALILIFFFLWMALFLLAGANAHNNNAALKASGCFGFLSAVVAWYAAVAELVNEAWGRHVLPGLHPLYSPQRTRITPESIASLISYNRATKTLFLQFRGLQITSLESVQVIGKAIEDAIFDAKTPNNKVDVVGDYKDMYVADHVQEAFWAMEEHLQTKYYLSITRFHVSSFGTGTNRLPLMERFQKPTATSDAEPFHRSSRKTSMSLRDELRDEPTTSESNHDSPMNKAEKAV